MSTLGTFQLLPSSHAHLDSYRAGTVDGQHPPHRRCLPVPSCLRVGAVEMDPQTLPQAGGRLRVTSGLSPVPLCPVCAQISMNAARRTEGATKYATTSQAASTAPATAATSFPRTAGPAKVRPWVHLQALPGPSPPLLGSLLPAPPLFCFGDCQLLRLSATSALCQRLPAVAASFAPGEEGGGCPEE